MQIFKECPLCRATNIAKTMTETYLSVGSEGFCQLGVGHDGSPTRDTNNRDLASVSGPTDL